MLLLCFALVHTRKLHSVAHTYVAVQATAGETTARVDSGFATLSSMATTECDDVGASASQLDEQQHFFSTVAPQLARDALNNLKIDIDQLGLQVNLYKVLLYEVGGHFKTHRDAEKEPGMRADSAVWLNCSV